MPSPTRPKPSYGQVWRWEETDAVMMLLAPSFPYGVWRVLFLSFKGEAIRTFTGDTMAMMFGLYADRGPIDGYTYLGDTK